MRRLLVIVPMLLACQRDHHVKLLLGPDDDSLSIGFACVDGGGTPLIARALVGDALRFQLVVDMIGVGPRAPGCRGEDLVKACADGSCRPLVVSADGLRACMEITIEAPRTPDSIRDQLVAALAGFVVTDDAPDVPVVIRAVATLEPCAAIITPQGDTYAPLEPAQAIGCAYSCPLQLDDVDGPVSLYLDALSSECEAQVRSCAAFPVRP